MLLLGALNLMRLLARIPDRYSVLFDAFVDGTCRDLHASDIVLITSFLSKKLYDFVREKQERGVHVKVIYTHSVSAGEVPDDIDLFSYIGEESGK